MKTTLTTGFPSASEWLCLLAVYDLGGVTTPPDAHGHLAHPRWTPTAVRVMLTKLAEKGWVEKFQPDATEGTRVGRGRRASLYRVVVPEDEAVRRFASHLAEVYFGHDEKRIAALAGCLTDHQKKSS